MKRETRNGGWHIPSDVGVRWAISRPLLAKWPAEPTRLGRAGAVHMLLVLGTVRR